jgi:hypothetical protein
MLQGYTCMFQVYVLNVSSISDVCCNSFIWMLHIHACCNLSFKCFIRMLQVFHLDVAKVNLDVVYTCMLQSVCFKYFIHMLQVFHLDIT